MKMTANLYADQIENCIDFWVKRLEFEKTIEVPGDKGLVFAAVRKGNIELMYATYVSLDKDLAGKYQRGASFLFVEVDDLDAVLGAMEGLELVLPVHKTFYGATEFAVADPAGHLITFAQFA